MAERNWFSVIADGLKNVLTGRGTQVDKSAHSFWHFMPMGSQQIEAAYRASWLIRKIVNLPADDMTSAWRVWALDKEKIKAIEKLERELHVIDELLTGLIYGRLGGGIVVLGTKGDMSRPAQDGEQLLYVKALPKQIVQLGELDWDYGSGNFGQPSSFKIVGQRGTDEIHPDRVIAFRGERNPGLTALWNEETYWGDSVVEVVDRAVKNVDTATDGFATLIEEAKIDVFSLAGLAETLLQPDGESKITKRVEETTIAKSLHRAIFLDGEDEYHQKQIAWTGMPDVIRAYCMVAAGAADIPATRLFGKAPDGQNATGEGDDKNYRAMIGTKQSLVLRPALEKIDRFMLSSLQLDEDATYAFPPLTTPTEKEQADVEKLRAETIKIYDDTGLLPREAFARSVQAKLVEDDTYPSFDVELAKIPESERVPEPEENITDPSKFANPKLAPAARPARRAVNDAAPRSLYVSRKVLNASDIVAWAKAQGFTSTLLPEDMHVTIAFSRQELDWMEVETNWGADEDGGLLIKPGGARLVEPLGDQGAIVLLFNSSELSWRHEQIKQAGASSDYDDYQPHVTITYRKPEYLDLKTIEPYVGAIRLGPERFKELNPGWNPDEVEEI